MADTIRSHAHNNRPRPLRGLPARTRLPRSATCSTSRARPRSAPKARVVGDGDFDRQAEQAFAKPRPGPRGRRLQPRERRQGDDLPDRHGELRQDRRASRQVLHAPVPRRHDHRGLLARPAQAHDRDRGDRGRRRGGRARVNTSSRCAPGKCRGRISSGPGLAGRIHPADCCETVAFRCGCRCTRGRGWNRMSAGRGARTIWHIAPRSVARAVPPARRGDLLAVWVSTRFRS